MPMKTPGALEGLTVLDMSGSLGNYCGKLFAELGADVVLIEPITGNDLRREPPFVVDMPAPERSLSFFYNNTGKRGISLDLTQESGRDVLKQLVIKADLLIEDLRPGSMASLGLSPQDLLAINPQLVVTSITPFGQTGPYAQYEHSDIVCLALGGMLWMGGYADGPPVRVAGNQAYMAGNLFGAVASMSALTYAELQGEGQHVDVSVQECVVMGLENAVQFYDLEGHIRRRFGGRQRQAGYGVFPCKDGHIFLIAGGIGGNRFWPNLVEWMQDEEVPEADALDGLRWNDRDFIESDEGKDLFWRIFTSFSKTKTKAYLYDQSQQQRVPLCPVSSPRDVFASKQLISRRFFHEVEAFGRTFEMPGAPYQLSDTPWQYYSNAPGLGEHTDEVLSQHGYSGEQIVTLRSEGIVR